MLSPAFSTGKPYLTGTLAADNVWWTNTLTPFRMGIKTVFFPDACTNGKIPVSFRARFALRSGYTYQKYVERRTPMGSPTFFRAMI
jgi:hypothetical protein